MAAITKVFGYGGIVDKRAGASGVVEFVAKITDGAESPMFKTQMDARRWLQKHAPVVSINYRAQVRRKGRPAESATFPSRKEAKEWAQSLESAIRENRHFPHAAAKRTSFDALAKDYVETVLIEYGGKERAARARQLKWWSDQFTGLTLADVTADRISMARDKLAKETFTRSRPRKPSLTDANPGETLSPKVAPKRYPLSGATVNRYIAALSHALSFAVKERRLMERNPVSDIRRKAESRGRTRFLSDAERALLLKACEKSEWKALSALVLLAITTGARKGELLTLKWADVNLKEGRALVSETKHDEPRTLPIAGKALEAIRALKLNNSARSTYVFPAPTVVLDPKSGKPQLDEPYEHIETYWYRALEEAGISNFRFHDLRHTTASMLAAQGASLLEIADVLGHKTLAMVKRYSHLVVEHKATVIEKMIAAKGL